MQQARGGSGSNQNFTLASGGSQQWNLGVIGNWNDFNTDLNGDGQYQSSNDRMVAGTFNGANEITQLVRTLQGGSPTTLSFTHDKAGNLREQVLNSRFTLRYTHDAWNRLVKVEQIDNGTTVTDRGEYQYNGLGQRVVKRSDHDVTDGTNALDEQRLLYYSAGWQIVEERIDDAWTSGHTTDRIVQHIWGLRYIDDLVLMRQDTNADGDYVDKADLNHYALTDHQFSVIARITDTGALVDRIAYTPYGEARHQWYNDVNGDGAVNSADTNLAGNASGNAIYQSNYNVDADFDRDGDVDSNDTILVGSTYYKAALPGGWIGSAGSAHTIGYCGYVFNQESGLYTVRFRHYDPVWGRWINRDPAGYVDGPSLYEYVGGTPLRGIDPFGLADDLDDKIKEILKKFIETYIEQAKDALGATKTIVTITTIERTVQTEIEIVLTITGADGSLRTIRINILKLEQSLATILGVAEDELNSIRNLLATLNKMLAWLTAASKAVNAPANMKELVDLLYELMAEDNPMFQRLILLRIVDLLKKAVYLGKYSKWDDLAQYFINNGILGLDDWNNDILDKDTRETLRRLFARLRDILEGRTNGGSPGSGSGQCPTE